MKKILEECTVYRNCLTVCILFLLFVCMYINPGLLCRRMLFFTSFNMTDLKTLTITGPTERCGREGEVSSFSQHHWTVKALYCLGNTAIPFRLII